MVKMEDIIVIVYQAVRLYKNNELIRYIVDKFNTFVKLLDNHIGYIPEKLKGKIKKLIVDVKDKYCRIKYSGVFSRCGFGEMVKCVSTIDTHKSENVTWKQILVDHMKRAVVNLQKLMSSNEQKYNDLNSIIVEDFKSMFVWYFKQLTNIVIKN